MANKVVVVVAADNQTQEVFNQIKQNVAETKGSVEGLGAAMEKIGIGLILEEGIRKMVEMSASAIETADAFEKMAQKTGMSTEQLSKLAFAFNIADVSRDEMEKGLIKFEKAIGSAAAGGDKAGAAFRSIGVNIQDSSGHLKSANDIFMDTADRISKMQDGAQKTAIVLQLFGKAGANLIPGLNEGKKGLEELSNEAERFGVVIDSEAAQRAEGFREDLKRLGAMAEGATNQFVQGLIPALDAVARAFIDTSSKTSAWTEIGKAVGEAVNFVAKGFMGVAFAVDFAILKVEKFIDRMSHAGANIDLAAAGDGQPTLQHETPTPEGRAAEFDARTQALIDQFTKMFATMDSISPGKAARPGGGEGSDLEAENKHIEAILKAREQLAEAYQQQRLQLAKATAQTELTDLDAQHKLGLISDADFYTQKLQIQEAANKTEIDALNKQFQSAEKLRQQLSGKGNASGADEAQKKMVEIQTKISELVEKGKQDRIQADVAIIESNQKMRDEILKTAQEIERVEGTGSDAAIAHLREENELRRQKLVAFAGEGSEEVKQFDRLQAIQEAKLQIAATDAKIQIIEQNLADTEKKINDQFDRGLISLQARDSALAAAQSRSAAQLAAQKADLEAVASVAGPEAQAKVAQLGTKIDELRNPVHSLSVDIRQEGLTATTDFFSSMISGTVSAADAFKNFANSIIGYLAKMIAQFIAFRIISGIFGAFGGGLGVTVGQTQGAFNLGTSSLGSLSGAVPHAGGGSFASGMPMLVGELGPEIILPNSSGSVVPNSSIRGGHTIQNFIDARGADAGVEQRVIGAMKTMEDRAVKRAIQSIRESSLRK